jgi:16S rRNA C967 or C1407 C5-methylase (RsmB/RsmF family)
VVAAVLAETANARQISLHASIESLHSQSVLTAAVAERIQAALTAEGALRLLPGAFNTDGFFVALIERTA